jgi:hypothetical protein
MRRSILAACAIVVTVAFSGLASASASAEACTKKSGTGHQFLCVNKERVPVGKLYKFKGLIFSHTVLLGGPFVDILCTVIQYEGESHQEGDYVRLLKLVLFYKSCLVGKPSHCAIEKEAITSNELSGETLSPEEVLFLPTSGSTFATATLVNSGGTCTIAGKGSVTTIGKEEGEHGPACTIKEPEVEKTTHVLKCAGAKAERLEFFKETAALEGEVEFWIEAKEGEKTPAAIIEG